MKNITKENVIAEMENMVAMAYTEAGEERAFTEAEQERFDVLKEIGQALKDENEDELIRLAFRHPDLKIYGGK